MDEDLSLDLTEEREMSDAELDEILGIEHAGDREGIADADDDKEEGSEEDIEDEEIDEKKVTFKKKKPKKKKKEQAVKEDELEAEYEDRTEEAFKVQRVLVHERGEQREEIFPEEVSKEEQSFVPQSKVPPGFEQPGKKASETQPSSSNETVKTEQTADQAGDPEPHDRAYRKTGQAPTIEESLTGAARTIKDGGVYVNSDHAEEDYREQMGQITIRAAKPEDDSTLSKGLREMRRSEAVYIAKTLTQESGTASIYKDVRRADERLEKSCRDASLLIKEGKITLADLDSKDALKQKLTGIRTEGRLSAVDTKSVLSHREGIVKRFRVRSELLSRKDVLTKPEAEWIQSDMFCRGASSPRFGRVLEKYFAAEDTSFSKDVKFSNLRYEDVKKLRKQYSKRSDKKKIHEELLEDYERRLYKRELRLRVYGRGFIAKKPVRLTSHAITSAMSSNSDVGHFIHKTRVYLTSADIAKRALFLTGSYLKKHSLIGKVAGSAASAAKKKISSAVSNTKLVKAARTAGNTIRFTAKETYKFAAAKTKKLFHADEIKKRFSVIKERAYNKGSVRFVRKLSVKGKAAAKAAKTTYQKVAHVLSAPVRALGKITDFIRKVNLKVLGVIGGAVLTLFKLYNILLAIVMILLSIDSLLTSAGETGTGMVGSYIDMVRSVINYEDYSDMKDDIDYMTSRDRERYERARQIGESEPEDPLVTNGKTIDHYGSYDNPKGYTITLTDPYGIELPEGTTNARDIESLCIAMISNDLGMYKGYWRDRRMLDELIADMYDLLAYDITVEETKVYFCSHGCVTFYYHCNSADDYNYYYDIWANGGAVYTELVDLKAEDDGCSTHWVWDSYWHDYVEEPYCPGDHTARVCFGHKDAHINIMLYGLEYAMSHNIYPRDWRSKSYAPMIKEFVERGAWTNEVFCEYARRYYSGDWEELYGISLEGGIGFSTVDPLSDEQIEAIMALLPEDLPQDRKEIAAFALAAVGRVNYQWGGKASGSGWSATFGSATPDEKGRVNGLDCSGFVQWVYRSALGRSVPGSTAGFGGYAQIRKADLEIGDLGFYNTPGSSENHIGIYVGKDEYGNDTWVHCAGSTGSTYGSGNFTHFISLL